MRTDGRMHVRRGALRAEERPFRLRLVPLPDLPAESGAPAMVFASVADGDLVWTEGAEKVRSVPSSSFGHPKFLRGMRNALPDAGQSSARDGGFQCCNAGRAGTVSPEFHIFWGSRIGWFEPTDELPRHDKFRPNTRGLGGTQPPSNEPRGCPRATAGSGFAARRRLSARPADHP